MEKQYIISDPLPTYYANEVSWAVSLYDIQIDFGTAKPDPAQLQQKEVMPPVYVHTRIIMSPQQFKMFASKLQDSLKEYEKLFGPIGTEPISGK